MEESPKPIPAETEDVARKVIGAAIEVHRHVGPGYLEHVYEEALCTELELQNISHQRQAPVDITYKGKVIATQRLDLVVAPGLIVELKAVNDLNDLHKAQVLSYLKATSYRLGLLMNFNVEAMRLGIKRVELELTFVAA